MKRILSFLIFTFAMAMAMSVKADSWRNYAENSSEGKEFYVTFMHNNSQSSTQSLKLQLFMATRYANTHVYIYQSNGGSNKSSAFTLITDFVLSGDTCWTNPNSTDIYLDHSDQKYKSLRVVTDKDIALYAASSNSTIGDATLVMPANRLGKEYLVQMSGHNSSVAEFAVIATMDGITNVRITPTSKVAISGNQSHADSVEYTVQLRPGQVYYGTSINDTFELSGTKICADKDVAVYNGCQASYVSGYSKTSHICHQTVPAEMYGTRFALVGFQNLSYCVVKFTALYDNTAIKKNGQVINTINKGESYEYTWDDGTTSAYFETSMPSLCYQYMPGDERKGAPAMAYVASIDQAISSIKLSSFDFISTSFQAFVNVVTPTAAAQSMMVDGVSVGGQFQPMNGLTGYSFARISVTAGEHELSNAAGGFTAIAYSIDATNISYAYNAGFNCTKQTAAMLLDGEPVDSIAVCQDSDWMARFTATSIVPGDYDYVEWFDEYNGQSTSYGRDSIWNAVLSGVGDHTIKLNVHQHTELCNNEVVDVIEAKVRVNPRYEPVLAVREVCHSERIKVWDDSVVCDTMTANVVYKFPKKFLTIYGCDSIVTEQIRMIYPHDSTYYEEICEGESYQFHGREFSTAGTYPVLDSVGHCLYTETLVLTVNPVYLFAEADTVCTDHLPYTWRTQSLTGEPGVHEFYDNLKTAKGCDSIYKITLTINPAYFFTDTVAQCDNELPYSWHGQSVDKTGIYFDSLVTSKGCDSIHKLVFTVMPTFLHVDSIEMCNNDSVEWRDRWFFGDLAEGTHASSVQPGVYEVYDSLQTTLGGCDSVYKLVLTVKRSYRFTEEESICDYNSMVWRGHHLYGDKTGQDPSTHEVFAVGRYRITDSLTTASGCDSVYHLDLTVNQSYSTTTEHTICQGESYDFDKGECRWHNMIVGDHDTTVHYTTVAGCDSSFRLILHVNEVYRYDQYDTVCNNQSFYWNRGMIDTLIHETAGGEYVYKHHFTTVRGCDSLFTLHLLVKDTIFVPSVANIPDKGSYVWDGKVYAGEKYTGAYDVQLKVRDLPYHYSKKYVRKNGCDSLISLTIKVDSSYQKSLVRSTCRGEDYDFNGTPWSWKKDVVGVHDTTYEYLSVQGFDSTWHLTLTVNEVYLFDEADSVCQNEDYEWVNHGKTWIAGSLSPGVHVLYDSLKTIVTSPGRGGCDSVYRLTLTVLDTFGIYTPAAIPDKGAFLWDGKIYAGEKYAGYKDTVLPVRDEPYVFRHEYKSSCGCDSVVQMTIQVDSSYQKSRNITICQHDVYDFNGTPWTWKKDMVGTHDTTYAYQSVLGYDSTWHLTLTVNPVYFIPQSDAMCVNDVYDWAGHNKTFSGLGVGVHVFYDSLKTAHTSSVQGGCDSVYELTLTVKDTAYVHTPASIPDNGHYVWNGKTYAGTKYTGSKDVTLAVQEEPYFFRDTLTAVNGCDSFVSLSIQVDSSYQKTRNITICQHDVYNFNGTPWTWKKDVVGVHDTTYAYQSVLGYDSTWHLTLTVNPVYFIPQSDAMCVNDVYDWTGHNRTFSGLDVGVHVFYDSLQTAHTSSVQGGCDSIYQLTLTVKDTAYAHTPASIPDNGHFVWDGRTYAGVKYTGQKDVTLAVREEPYLFRDTLTAVNGCDSFRTLSIQVDSSYQKTRNITICQHDTYLFNGVPWTWKKDEVGVHDTLIVNQSVLGYDSTWHLTLTVNPVYLIPQSDAVCVNEAYEWRGRSYSGLGVGVHVLYDSLQTEHTQYVQGGCDSIYQLTLTVIDTTVTQVTNTMCDNNMMSWLGLSIAGDKYRGAADTAVSAGKHVFRKVLTSTATGCDSMVYLTLTVIGTFEDSASIATAQHKSYYLNGVVWTWKKEEPGVHDTTYVFKNSQGLDSVWHLHLVVHPAYLFKETDQMCENEPFEWRGKRWEGKSPGVYVIYDSLVTRYTNADSVYQLTLTVNDTAEVVHYLTICDNDTVTWDGELIAGDRADTAGMGISRVYQAREYAYQIEHRRKRVATQCDSVEKLRLTVRPTYTFHEDTSLCARDGFMWRNRRLTTNGTYTDSFKTVHGCDSVYSITLKLDLATFTQQNVTLCEGDSFEYRGRNLGKGVYFDTVSSTKGCDSVIMIVVNEMPSYHYRQSAEICEGDVYQWHGQSLTQAGTHFDHKRTQGGCDSTYELTLTVIPEFHDVAYDTVCLRVGENYKWRGKEYGESGVYYDSLRRANDGCDSVYELRLTLWRSYIMDDYIEICEGDSFDFRGRTVTKGGIYFDSLLTRHGCDSIYRLVFNVTRTYHFNDTVQICDGEVYSWRGRDVRNAGTYRDSFTTVGSGCDSIYELLLVVKPKYHWIKYDTVCSNETYEWRTKFFTESGTYFDSIRTSDGCDSVYELRLTVNSSYLIEQSEYVCQGQSFDFRGKPLTVPGVYYDTLISSHGCDSIYKLTFNVMKTYYYRDTVEICDGSSYSWHGKDLTHQGLYYDSLTTFDSGCDSIYEIMVYVKPKFHNIEYDTVCTNGTYEWRNKYFTESGVYFDSLKTVNGGCDSVYELRLTLNHTYLMEQTVNICQGGSFSFRGQTVSTAGVYYDSLVSSHGCDSVYKMVVNVMPTYHYYDTANVCRGDAYSWHGRSLAKAGTHYDSLLTVSGCDSVYELYLTVSDTYYNIEYDTVCTNGTYRWHGKDYDRSGVYYDSLKTVHSGCDSVFELRLTIYPSYLMEQTVSICQGESFSFRGRMVSTAGVYYDSMTTVHGCDSVIKYVVRVNPTHHYYDTANVCRGDAYSWRGRSISTGGTYYDSLLTVNGCDSIYELYLTVSDTYYNIEYDTVCTNNTYRWHGKDYDSSGVYYDSLKTALGCDSVFELRLTVYPSYLTEQTVSICQGGSFSFRGRMVSTAGVYYDSMTTVHGCDSVMKYVVRVNPTHHYYDTANVCRGDAYSWRGRSLAKAGTHYDSLQTVNGCDSIYELYLTVSDTYYNIEYDTVCTNETYRWHGRDYDSSGVYYDSLKTALGCDSVFELRLTVRPSYLTEQTVSICQGGSFSFRGRMVSTAGIYYDSMTTVHGCDSVMKYVVRVNPTHHYYDTANVCRGNAYSWRGRSLTKAGTHYDSLLTVNGCDSIYELYLTVSDTYYNIEYDTVCTNETYRWHGKDYDSSGVYYDSLKTALGCDSVFELRLTVRPSYLMEQTVSICQGGSFSFRGRMVSTAGVYYDSMTTVHGCDSVMKYVVRVNPTHHYYDSTTICRGGSYSWRGRTITTGGTHYDSLRTMNGCDSVYEIFVKVADTYYNIEYDTICTNETYRWHGKDYDSSGVYYDSLKTALGCDSVFELRLTVYPSYLMEQTVSICQGGSFSFRGHAVSTAGVYYDSMTTVHGCDSVMKYVVRVNPTYHYYDSTTICRGGSYSWRGRTITTGGKHYDSLRTVNGCDSVYEIYVRVADTYYNIEYDTVCTNETYRWHGKDYDSSGVYYDSLHTQFGCDSVFELRLTVYPSYLTEQTVSICQGSSFSFRGHAVSTAGVYYDSMKTAHGCDSVMKYVVRVNPTYHYYDSTTICRGGSYSWRGRTITSGGTHYDSMQTVNGCDSIYEINVRVKDSYHIVESDSVCMNGTYRWHGRDLNASGIYFDSLNTAEGCDSVYELHLTLNRPYLIVQNINLCQGDVYHYRGNKVDSAGIYYDSLKTSQGCDSVIKYVVNVHPTYHFNETVTICDGDTFPWHGQAVTNAGTYFANYHTVNGCDSVYEIEVTKGYKFHDLKNDTICQNTTYHWRNQYIDSAGVYYDSIKTALGCDSVYELRLEMYPNEINVIYHEICEGDTFMYGGRRLTMDGTYVDTSVTSHGCKKITRLYLSVSHPQHTYHTDSICQGETYDFYGTPLTAAGEYTKCLSRSAAGCCETVQHLTLVVRPSYSFMPEQVTICSDTGYRWHGKTLTHSGIYYDSIKTRYGCDSVYTLNLTLDRPSIEYHYDSLCEGESLWFRDRWLTKSGTYDDTISTTYGCDSIYRLVLNVKRTSRVLINRDICNGSLYNFRGTIVNKAGTYFDTVWNGHCMDSVFILTVATHSNFYKLEGDTICQGDMYHWHGQDIATAGIYFDSIRSQWGCDSVYELRLTVDTPRTKVYHDTLCYGESITINNRIVNEPGSYYDTVPRGPKLCDSIIRRVVTVLPQLIFYEGEHEICDGDSFLYHNIYYRNGGTLRYVRSGVGKDCDTTFWMTLKVKPLFYEIRDTSVCEDDSLWFFGSQVYVSGTYIHTEYDRLGCDSVYEWHVTINRVQRDSAAITVCENSPYTTPTGKVLRETGVYIDTLVSSKGCDSIVTYIVNKQNNFQIFDTLNLCRGGVVYGKLGHSFTQPGDYTYTINLRPGIDCDTIYYAHVQYGNIVVTHTHTVCQGDTLWFRGQGFTKTGVYPISIPSPGGGICDSTHVINLTVNPVPTTVLFDTTCDNQGLWFFGKFINQTGVYRDSSLRTTHGCDSIIELHLVVHDKMDMPVDSVNICETDSYVWRNGLAYNKAGIYTMVDTDAVTGCRRYWTLKLTVTLETHLISVTSTGMCQDDETYSVTPIFTGPAPIAYSLRYDGVNIPSYNDVLNVAYDGSAIVMPIPKNQQGSKVRPDNYTVTMQLYNDLCVSGSEVMTFTLQVRYPSSILEQHFQNVVSVLNYNYNGGYQLEDFRWYVNSNKLNNQDKSNLYNAFNVGDTVYAELRRVGENYFVATCPIIIQQLGPDDLDHHHIDGPYPISINRTYINPGDNTTLVKATENAIYRLSTTSGIILQSGSINKNQEIELELPYVAGCYFLIFDAENAGRKVFKIVVH